MTCMQSFVLVLSRRHTLLAPLGAGRRLADLAPLDRCAAAVQKLNHCGIGPAVSQGPAWAALLSAWHRCIDPHVGTGALARMCCRPPSGTHMTGMKISSGCISFKTSGKAVYPCRRRPSLPRWPPAIYSGKLRTEADAAIHRLHGSTYHVDFRDWVRCTM